MNRGFRVLLFVLIALTMTTAAVFADDPPIRLELDGKVVQTEVPPIIVSGRTMAPAKYLFEAMGGTVDWFEQTRQVKIVLEDTTVLLTIDSKGAQVNGQTVTMDVAPMIKNGRTLVPTSFVAQQLGFTVNWVNDTRTVQIITPVPVDQAEIISIDTERLESDTYRIIVEADGELGDFKGVFYDSPDRYSVDIKGAELTMVAEGQEGSIHPNNSVFSTVRYAQFDDSTVRIVADLAIKAKAELSLSPDKKTLFIDLKADDSSSNGNMGDTGNTGNDGSLGNGGNNGWIGDSTTANPDLIAGLDIPLLDGRMQDKLVVIDPGHGGVDSGSLGYDSNRKIIQMEKDLNIAVALRLNQLLQAAGVRTYMLRTDDSTMALYDRPAKANELGGYLYVAIHNNSNDSAAPSGTETHYYSKASEAAYGYGSKQVADLVQAELMKSVGLKNRGIKSSPTLAVLNRSQMPAIIIEGAFISNPTELAYMMTDAFKEAYALGAARGIVKAMNEVAAGL